MERKPGTDPRIQDWTQSHQFDQVDVSGTLGEIAPANPNRLGLWVSSKELSVAGAEVLVAIGTQNRGAVDAIAVIGTHLPTIYLSREDYGPVICGDIWAADIQGAGFVVAGEITLAR